MDVEFAKFCLLAGGIVALFVICIILAAKIEALEKKNKDGK